MAGRRVSLVECTGVHGMHMHVAVNDGRTQEGSGATTPWNTHACVLYAITRPRCKAASATHTQLYHSCCTDAVAVCA